MSLAGISACRQDNQIGDDCDSTTSTCEPTTRALEKAIKNVDILVVIDKSKSMLHEQANLAREMPKLVKALITGDRDGNGVKEFTPAESVHLGVVTSDLGLPGMDVRDNPDPINCVGQGDDGILYHKGNPSIDPTCKASYPTFISHKTGTDDPGKTAADFGCMLQVGPNGCGFEQPLEAALKALWPSKNETIKFPGDTQGHGDLENAGFLRADSLLAIVVVSDEDDCSTGAQGNLNLLVNNNSDKLPAFLKEDLARAAKVNLRCEYDDELPAAERYRWPIERYLDGFRALRAGAENRVIFGMIGGVPTDLVDKNSDLQQAILGDITADAADIVAYYGRILDDPRMTERQADGAATPQAAILEPACTVANPAYALEADAGSDRAEQFITAAEPARRYVALAQAFGVNGVVQSICEESFTSPIERLALAISNRIKVSAGNLK